MKHAAVLYTCIGLMGAAAVTGFVDYTQANKSGVLANLYQDEKPTTGKTLISVKDISVDDYSRAALEERTTVANQQEEKSLAKSPKPKKRKKSVPPPPPPPPKTKSGKSLMDVKEVPAPPAEVDIITAEIPAVPPIPAVEEKIATPPVAPVEEVKEVTFSPRIFSRAPLPRKYTAAKKKKRS